MISTDWRLNPHNLPEAKAGRVDGFDLSAKVAGHSTNDVRAMPDFPEVLENATPLMPQLSLNDASDIATVRKHLKDDSRHRFVNRQQFCELLVSTKSLQRFDVGHGKLRGLIDRSSGDRYLIEEEKLYPADSA